jgi:ATP-dependent Lon protease
MSRYELYAPNYSLLPLKNVVIFPRNIVTLLVGRARSIQAVDEALNGSGKLVVTAHRDGELEDPRPEELHAVGTLASIVQHERQPNGNVQVVLEGISRVRLTQFDRTRPFFTVYVEELKDAEVATDEAKALIRHVQDLTAKYAEARSKLSNEVIEMVQRASEPGQLADLLATQLLTEAHFVARRQELLELIDPVRRLEQVAVHLSGEIDNAALEQKIKARVRDQIDKNQREYFLREQLKAIHDELGGENGNEIETFRSRINERGLPPAVSEKLLKELARLERMPPVSAEATVVRSYLETLLSLPWSERTEDRLDIDEAERILEADHYGLEQVKDRILDFLAVRKLTAGGPTARSAQILCFVGPPGVGKTSLGQSIATSMGRNFVRVSLGGVRDEAEIRGHRRTYIGALPGQVVGAMKKAGTINPVMLLDEIDKLSSDYRGDPASAMLEVLDPEQNSTFTDHFLDVPYDLSHVFFIATANNAGAIPRPMRDRMELIEISGYTEDEKIEIAKRYLLPKQLEAHGLAPEALVVPEPIWRRIVREYTREAGVRNLNREMAAICRKLARDTVSGRQDDVATTDDGKTVLSERLLERSLGPRRFGYDKDLGESQVGVAIGLGTTDVGGELIPVEVATMPGRGALTITGRAGDVMQESARAALSYARSRAAALNIPHDFQEKQDLHIHLPEGATPKDGPSAGITMATALISSLTGRPVRGDTAMTGEITLRGRVLPIGGLKDKTLAAHRHGIRRLIAPAENQGDVVKIPENIRTEMEFVFVTSMDEVIAAAILLDPAVEDRLATIDGDRALDERPLPAAENQPALEDVTVDSAP